MHPARASRKQSHLTVCNEPEHNGMTKSKVLTGVRIGSRGCAKFVERANLI